MNRYFVGIMMIIVIAAIACCSVSIQDNGMAVSAPGLNVTYSSIEDDTSMSVGVAGFGFRVSNHGVACYGKAETKWTEIEQ